MPPRARQSPARAAHEATGGETVAGPRDAAPAAKAGTARRLAWLSACVLSGAVVGAAGQWLTGHEWWYLAVPVLLALAWWQVADPTCCERDSGTGD